MASGLLSAGTDLDSILALIAGTPARANVGILVAGSDIASRYAQASSGVAAGNVGIKSGGTDIGPLFAAIGTLQYSGTVVAAQAGTSPNESFLFVTGGTYGSISPTTWKGKLIYEIVTTYSLSGATSTVIITNNTNSATWLTTITVTGGVGGPFTLHTSAATYAYNSGNGDSTWSWGVGNILLNAAGSFTVSMT